MAIAAHIRTVVGALLVALPAMALRADTIHLKNGRTVDGIVTRETDAAITLDVGVGAMTLKKSQIASIEKSDPAARAKIQEDWKRHFFTNTKYTPKGFEDLASAFSGLEQQRQSAGTAEKTIRQLKEDIDRTAAEIQSESRELVGVAQRVSTLRTGELKTSADVAEYNSIIDRNNALNSGVIIKQDAMAKSKEQIDAEMKKTAEYMQALDRFAKTFAKRSAAAAPIPTNDAPFFATIDARLKGYQAELKRFDVAYEDDRSSVIVQVRINDKATGRFVVDTGASQVSLSTLMASRLNLQYETNRADHVSVADGRVIDAYPVVLATVQVGEARAERVAAHVLDSEPAPGIDGLLGLSFLQEFDFHYDATGHRLELTRFKPE